MAKVNFRDAQMREKILQFLLEQSGGKNVVMKNFCSKRLVDLAFANVTLAAVIAHAKDEDWFQVFGSMRLQELVNLVNPSKKTKRAKALTPTRVKLLRKRIQSYLQEHPWSSRGDIHPTSMVTISQLDRQLRALRDSGIITRRGIGSGTRYALTD